jgi:DHA1 family bicyclomycin/chloramphenicol resistance-like MFS transporter
MLPFYLYMMGHGVHQPCGQSGAVSPFPQTAGAASALAGFVMMVVAFGIGGWLGLALAEPALGAGTVRPLTDGIWLWSTVIAAIAWTLVRRHGDAHAPPQRLSTP